MAAARLRGLIPALTLLAVAACDTDGGGTLLPPAPTGPTPNPRLVLVVDGFSLAPVPSARAVLEGRTYTTDPQGRIELDTPVPCATTAINAVGYLERRLKCLSTATAGGGAPVTLWPAASPEERTALQQFAFRGQLNLVYPSVQSIGLSDEVSDRAATTVAWQRAAQRLAEVSRGRLTARVPVDVVAEGEGVIVAPWSDATQCSATTHYDETGPFGRFLWPLAVSGYCWQAAPNTFTAVLRVAASQLARDSTALRALLAGAGFSPHALPGLMNRNAPDETLSDFERRTLHMVGLRAQSWPSGINWPDSEQ